MKKIFLLLTVFLTLTASINAQSLNFDATDDFVATSTLVSTATADITMEVSIKWAGGLGNQCVFYNGTTSSSGYGIYVINGELNVLMGGVTTQVITTLTTNTWTHLALVNDAVNWTVYIDGISIQTFTAIPLEPTGSTLIGGNPLEFFNGSIDDVRFWEIARTPLEIMNTKNCSFIANQAGLVLNYNFNDGVANADNTAITTIIDHSGFNNTGTLNNFALIGTTSNFTDNVTSLIPSIGISVAPASATVCSGANVSITASGATSYTWDNGITNAVNFNPTATQTYTVLATDANGCRNTTTSVITVNPLPVLTITASNDNFCDGGSVILTTTGASSYTWDNGVVDGVSFTPAATQTYTVTGIDANTCISTLTSVITVKPSPVLTITSSPITSFVCEGSNLTLTGSGASTYTWNYGVTDGLAFIPTGTKIYSVTGTAVNGCSSSESKQIAVNPVPVLTISPSTTVCAGALTSLTATGASSYVWNNGIVNGVPFAAPTTTKTYTVTGTTNGCSASGTRVVTVNSLPPVGITAGGTTFCSGATITLSGTGASTYTWNNGISNGVAFAATTATVLTYTVTGTAVNGCKNTASRVITVNPTPALAVAISPNVIVCNGQSVTLTATGASSYTWDNSVENGVSFIPTETKTYTVTGVSSLGCSKVTTATVGFCVGVNDVEQERNITIYPNPNNGKLFVKIDLQNVVNTEIKLYNTLGQTVLCKQLTETINTIDTESLENGIYWVELKGINQKQKLIIAK